MITASIQYPYMPLSNIHEQTDERPSFLQWKPFINSLAGGLCRTTPRYENY